MRELQPCCTCSALGFGVVANDLFQELDIDGGGTVRYAELIASLSQWSKRATGAEAETIDALVRAHEAATRNERESFWFGGPDLQNTFLHGVAAGDGTEAAPFRLLWGDRPVQPTEATNRTGYI